MDVTQQQIKRLDNEITKIGGKLKRASTEVSSSSFTKVDDIGQGGLASISKKLDDSMDQLGKLRNEEKIVKNKIDEIIKANEENRNMINKLRSEIKTLEEAGSLKTSLQGKIDELQGKLTKSLNVEDAKITDEIVEQQEKIIDIISKLDSKYKNVDSMTDFGRTTKIIEALRELKAIGPEDAKKIDQAIDIINKNRVKLKQQDAFQQQARKELAELNKKLKDVSKIDGAPKNIQAKKLELKEMEATRKSNTQAKTLLRDEGTKLDEQITKLDAEIAQLKKAKDAAEPPKTSYWSSWFSEV
jgi:chromosome segregation ATPase